VEEREPRLYPRFATVLNDSGVVAKSVVKSPRQSNRPAGGAAALDKIQECEKQEGLVWCLSVGSVEIPHLVIPEIGSFHDRYTTDIVSFDDKWKGLYDALSTDNSFFFDST
jgi:hypothetical protein